MKTSMKHKTEPKISEEINDETLTKTNLKGDWLNIFLLLLLYTIQSMSISTTSSLSILLQSKKTITYKEQALFNLSSLPFSLKLLWAPIVDTLYIQKFGWRKSWLIPTQFLIGVILIYTASDIKNLLPETGKPNIMMLLYLFSTVNVLAATQDIAVDGWALTMLKKNNVGYAGTCNAVGSTIGSMISSMVLILFTSQEFSNNYLRITPGVGGIVSLENVLYYWGILFMLVTISVAIFKTEKEKTFEDDHEKIKVIQSYSLLWNIMKLPSIRILVIILITSKIGYAATSKVTTLKFIDAGIPKENISMISTAMSGVNILIPLILAKYTSGPKPMSVYLKFVPSRLLLNIAFAVIIYYVSRFTTFNGVTDISIYFYAILVLTLAIEHVIRQTMFVSGMSFYSRISDPRFGGTYMTLLNTVTNLASSWTSTLALGMIDVLTFKECSTNSKNNCATIELTNTCEADKGDCITIANGYYVEIALFTTLGIIWYLISKNILKRLQTTDATNWLVNLKSPVTE